MICLFLLSYEDIREKWWQLKGKRWKDSLKIHWGPEDTLDVGEAPSKGCQL